MMFAIRSAALALVLLTIISSAAAGAGESVATTKVHDNKVADNESSSLRGGADNKQEEQEDNQKYPQVTLRHEQQRNLGLSAGEDGVPFASVIQGLLGVLEKTKAASGEGCSRNSPCSLCEGDCETDRDCQGDLRCYQRENPYTAVPGCVGAENRKDTRDFCYMPPEDVGPDLDNNRCKRWGEGQCGLCQGDCDTDDDCEGDLKCFHRHYSETAVPGCYGGEFDETRFDYCYLPPPPAKNEIHVLRNGCSEADQCPKCRGDCDSDDDCYGNLRCWRRDHRYQFVPGCLGGDHLEDEVDFCYDPRDDNQVKDFGGCSFDRPCEWCTGDCDTDDDCAPGLVCFQRDLPYTYVPGCKGGEDDKGTSDYCVNPLDNIADGAPAMSARSHEEVPQINWDSDFFNYDLTDTRYGPIGWDRVDVDGNIWQRFSDPSTGSNRCNGDKQSPIDLTYANEDCEETHHIYRFGGDVEKYNERGGIEFTITPFRLRIVYEELDNAEPPGIDPPGGVAGGITQKDLSHAELMIPSEHAIGGRKFDGEYRIYHAQDNYDDIIALAVLISTEEDKHNHFWEPLIRKWEKVEECGDRNGYTDRDMGYKEIYNMIDSMYFWAYEGSLTAPPCSEIVQWRVIDTPVHMSKAQFERTEKLLRDGGPCKDHPARKTIGRNGVARPIQRTSRNSKVWRCTVDDYDWDILY